MTGQNPIAPPGKRRNGNATACDLRPEERVAFEEAIVRRGLDPTDFRAEAINYPAPDFGPSIRHIALEVERIRSLLWSDEAMTWIERLHLHLDAGIYDEGGFARVPDSWGDMRSLPFPVYLEQLND